jgi:prevent-host-death family protein
MPKIMPVSDLRNYNEVLRNVSENQPVFLTRNGRGRYAILDLDEYEKTQVTLQLMSELAKGEQSAKIQGWLAAETVEEASGL